MRQVTRFLTPHRRKALDFLKNELSDRKRLSVAEIQSKARNVGISQSTLSYCRKLLKIQITRDGQTGIFYWQLPF